MTFSSQKKRSSRSGASGADNDCVVHSFTCSYLYDDIRAECKAAAGRDRSGRAQSCPDCCPNSLRNQSRMGQFQFSLKVTAPAEVRCYTCPNLGKQKSKFRILQHSEAKVDSRIKTKRS